MPSFSPYSLSAQFAKSAVGRLNRVWAGRVSKPNSTRSQHSSPRPTISDSVVHDRDHTPPSLRQEACTSEIVKYHIQSDEHLAIKKEDDDDSLVAAHDGHFESDENKLADHLYEDDLLSQQGEVVTTDHPDGRDEPIQSIEGNDRILSDFDISPSLRGGRHNQDNVDTAEEDQDDNNDDDDDDDVVSEDAFEAQINIDDYYESEDDFQDEYDVDDEDVADYRVERTKVNGIATWPREMARAHKTLALRGAYSLMPSSWAWDLIDHPFVEGLFAPTDSDKRLLFQEQSSQFRATRALRDLFELHIRICAYRQDGLHDRIAGLIEQQIASYNASVEKDVRLRGYYDYVSPLFIIKFGDLDKVSLEEGETLGGWVHQQATQVCQARVEQYRAEWIDCEVDQYPRFIYTFVIIQQTVVIWAIDTDLGEPQIPYVLASLDMSKRTAWLETSLAIAITIHLAKESLCAYRSGFPRMEEQDDDLDA